MYKNYALTGSLSKIQCKDTLFFAYMQIYLYLCMVFEGKKITKHKN